MYIRWVRRGHKSKYAAHVNFHDAYLVESYRDEYERPRQRTISYLGNIRQIDGQFSAIERELFLLRAQEIMNNLPELEGLDSEEMLAQLHRRVPPVGYDEALRAFKENLRWFQQWCESNDIPFPVNELQAFVDQRKPDILSS